MIGGYIHRRIDVGLESRLRQRIDHSFTAIDAWDCGFLFCDHPYSDDQTSRLVSHDLVALSQDLLVATDADDQYRPFDLAAELPGLLAQDEPTAFDAIASDYRMAVVRRRGEQTTLFLVSNRAGSGRIYLCPVESGVLFSSDLRFLLGVIKGEVSRLGIYSILKYGAVPEPMTICNNVDAVPPAHFLRYQVNDGSRSMVPYFRFRFPADAEEHPPGDAAEILEPAKRALRRSSRFLRTHRPAILLSGGIDSSLYGCYLNETGGEALQGFYCAFGDDDPELVFAQQIARRLQVDLHMARMGRSDATRVLDDVTRLTDHPFADFSSLPITFLFQYASERMGQRTVLIECNGGDDCFGFPDLANEKKYALKHRFPRSLKRLIAATFKGTTYWKWEGQEGALARACALSDSHEKSLLDYFLVLAPLEYLGVKPAGEWDETLQDEMERVFSRCGADYEGLGYGAKMTIRQLLHVNSRRWAAKALSVGESLGIRAVYPFIWREVLVEQGRIPWSLKIKDGIVKWPLKRLLEQYMPESFIYRKKSGFVPPFATWLTDESFNRRVREILLDRGALVTEVVPRRVLEELLSDALEGMKLRHLILNFLWGALFTEMWLGQHARP